MEVISLAPLSHVGINTGGAFVWQVSVKSTGLFVEKARFLGGERVVEMGENGRDLGMNVCLIIIIIIIVGRGMGRVCLLLSDGLKTSLGVK